ERRSGGVSYPGVKVGRHLKGEGSEMGDYLSRVDIASLESCLASKESRAVRRGAVGKVPSQVTRWPPILAHVQFFGGRVAATPLPYPARMEKGRNRLPVPADAYGPTNSGIRRSLASRPPCRSVTRFRDPRP